jgi:hypothetical protein
MAARHLEVDGIAQAVLLALVNLSTTSDVSSVWSCA